MRSLPLRHTSEGLPPHSTAEDLTGGTALALITAVTVPGALQDTVSSAACERPTMHACSLDRLQCLQPQGLKEPPALSQVTVAEAASTLS